MPQYQGSCHCGAISYTCTAPLINKGLRCNCSICEKKGAVMSEFTLPPEAIKIDIQDDSQSTYQFDSGVAKHHFCKQCGIYVFHETLRKPGHFRLNLGCVDEIDSLALPVSVFDGASL